MSLALVLALALSAQPARIDVVPPPKAPDNSSSSDSKDQEKVDCPSACKATEDQCLSSCRSTKDGRGEHQCRGICKTSKESCQDACAKAAPPKKKR